MNIIEREGEKDTDERRESSGKAPRLGAPLKGLEPWALLAVALLGGHGTWSG